MSPATVLVHGASLAGLAASARLAKAGHHVVLDADALPDGGHWAVQRQLGVEVDELPQTFLLPASWRDLFKKSGRTLEAELARHGLALVPAPGQRHLFADGREFTLPSERGEQFHAVEKAFGGAAATAWTALLDELDELWQALRMVGLERPATAAGFTRATRAALLGHTSLEELCQRAGDPHLACIVRSQASLAGAVPGRAPALLAVRLAVHRRFGSWQLVEAPGGEVGEGRPVRPVRASRMVELLTERLALRGVERTGGPTALLGSGLPDLSVIGPGAGLAADARLEALPLLPPRQLTRRHARPAYAPTISHQTISAAPHEGIVETIDHSAGAPVVSWLRSLGDGGSVLSVHDHTRPRPDLAWGLAPTSWKAWQQRPLLGGDGQWYASAASHGGNEPWAELLSAALAGYEIHEYLTGDDIRPTNRTPPRLPRQARPGSVA